MPKLITSIAGLQLVEQGKLNFDDLVTKYIPQFSDVVVLEGMFTPSVTSKPTGGIPTIGSLFDHSSGLSYFAKAVDPPFGLSAAYTYNYDGMSKEDAQEKLIELLKDGWPGIPLAFETGGLLPTALGSMFSGSSLSASPANVGPTLSDYCDENIFKRLGISSTFNLTAELKSRFPELAFRNPDGTITRWANQAAIINRYPDEIVRPLGGIGVYTTLADYLTILRHLLRIEAGMEVSNPLLQHETVKDMFKPRLTSAGEVALGQILQGANEPGHDDHVSHGTAFGLVTKDWEGKRRAGSGFWCGWAGTFFLLDPTTGIALMTGTQVVPSVDAGATALFWKLEEIVYANLED